MEAIIQLYNEYTELVRVGKSREEALAEFLYLHPITLSRLNHYIETEEKRLSSSLSQTTAPVIDNQSKSFFLAR